MIVFVCFGAATILAALAAFWKPSSPPPVNLLAAAIFFVALGLTVQSWGASGR